MGFGCQLRIRTILDAPAGGEAASEQAWDNFQDGRLAFLYPSFEKLYERGPNINPNVFLASNLVCTHVVRGSIGILAANEMLHFTESETWLSPSAKAAQRGQEWWVAVFRGLLSCHKIDGAPVIPMFSAHDLVDIMDIHPHTGDGAAATYALMKDSRFQCSFRHIIAQMGYKSMTHAAEFTLSRMLRTLAKEWCQGHVPLYDFEASGSRLVKKPVLAKAAAVAPEPYELQKVPGCYEAYQGITRLDLKVCRVTPGGLAKIAPEKLQEFSGANDLIKQEIKAIEEDHVKEIENLLIDLSLSDKAKLPEGMDDPRHNEEENPQPEDTFDNETFDSEESLKKAVDIQVETKMHGMHTVRVLRDSSNRIWALSSQDSATVPKTTLIGSYGTGKCKETDLENVNGRYVPFELPLGDRTPIIISSKVSTNDDEEDINSKLPETLYKAVKTLMKAHQGAPIKIGGMGTLSPITTGANKHGYEVEFPKGHDKYAVYGYELKAEASAGKKTTSGNFFVPLASPNGLVGALGLCWKCKFQQVPSKITPMKPFVCTTKTLHLKKGEPMLLGGPAQPQMDETA